MKPLRHLITAGLMLMVLIIGTALTQDDEEFSEVVVVYPDLTDTFTFDAEFWFGDVKDWAIPDFLKGLTPDGGTGDGGQVPQPNCDGLLLNLFDSLEIASRTGRMAESLLGENSGELALFYSDSNPANGKAVGVVFAGINIREKLNFVNIRSQMEALNCYKE